MNKEIINGFINYIDNSPTAFHAVENAKNILETAGFKMLCESENWQIEKGKSYFVIRNGSSIIAFKVPKTDFTGFNIVASHSDSPCFKLKENPEIENAGAYISLNTERYGGMIMSSWLDRPLSVAGRVVVNSNGNLETRLVNIAKDIAVIPNLAIHMDRNVNEGKAFNAQTDMLPLLGSLSQKGELKNLIGKAANADKEDIAASDLYLYNRQKACVMGIADEFIGSGRLDNLQCAYCSLQGLLNSNEEKSIAVCAVFDNEEIGSGTKQGAASTFLYDTLTRINRALGNDETRYLTALANSFMISADNAHGIHPNNSAVADKVNRPVINKGIAVKHSPKYTSDAVSTAIVKVIAQKAGVELQSYANRSDIAGGATLGNISNTQVAVNTVDIGLPQLAMHSAFETAGVSDMADLVKLCQSFYSLAVCKTADGYTVK